MTTNTRTQIERLQEQVNTALRKPKQVSRLCEQCGKGEQLVMDGEKKVCGACCS